VATTVETARFTVSCCSASGRPRSSAGQRTKAYASPQTPRWKSDHSGGTWPGPSRPRHLGPPRSPALAASPSLCRPLPGAAERPSRPARCATADRVSCATRPFSSGASRQPSGPLFGSAQKTKRYGQLLWSTVGSERIGIGNSRFGWERSCALHRRPQRATKWESGELC